MTSAQFFSNDSRLPTTSFTRVRPQKLTRAFVTNEKGYLPPSLSLSKDAIEMQFEGGEQPGTRYKLIVFERLRSQPTPPGLALLESRLQSKIVSRPVWASGPAALQTMKIGSTIASPPNSDAIAAWKQSRKNSFAKRAQVGANTSPGISTGTTTTPTIFPNDPWDLASPCRIVILAKMGVPEESRPFGGFADPTNHAHHCFSCSRVVPPPSLIPRLLWVITCPAIWGPP
ncbi:hypothetical protein CcaCcLH18_01696 [Colletotrichum camelliae]|nr:hypothetical protein CcaCcLH18_01696 [Colletotrichum camelliae]